MFTSKHWYYLILRYSYVLREALKVNEDQFCAGITLLWWRRALGGRSTVCCVQYLTIPFVLMHSWNVCSLWKKEKGKKKKKKKCGENKNDLFMSLLGAVSPICQVGPRLSCPACFISRTHPRASHLIVTGLYPEREEWLTMVDWQVYSSVAFLFLVITRSASPRLMTAQLCGGSQRCCAYRFFKHSTMLRVFHSWLESMWSGHGA